ncbi:MAG: hypothetical protein A2136_00420 [Chloroflexi bacterium RBG_16_54_11]|nr:MAG: hypothetical protein A2136_00420 [Chloroflexi bacterium RBG_16_54_11]
MFERAFEVIGVLKTQDMPALSGFVHPVQGLRLSPYAFVMDTDQLFSAEQIANMPADSKTYHWGEHAGSGEPIDVSFMDYYSRFIYDVDFANAPEISLDHPMGMGSSIDNAYEFYPGSMIVEFYFSGFDPQYGGMDWRSLRLVFGEYESVWYLVGMIHNQWTP